MRVDSVFSGQHVFITGVTGFVGQATLAALFRNAPDVARVSVLIRSTDTQTAAQRLQHLAATSQVLQGTRVQALVRAKVSAVDGDLEKAKLGIDPTTYADLTASVSVIIHSGADLNFTNPFRVACERCLLPTIRVHDMACACTRLVALCHVSTAYLSKAFSGSMVCEPVVQPVPIPLSVLLRALAEGDEELLRRCESALRTVGWANTYLMSKACAEKYLHQHRGRVPTIVIRPSMIACGYWEHPGWHLGKGGPELAIFAIAIGAVTILPHSVLRGSLDLIPVDYVANSILVSTAYLATLPPAEQTERLHIHHCTAGLHRTPQVLHYDVLLAYLRAHPVPRRFRVRDPRLAFVRTNTFQRQVMLRYKLPLLSLNALRRVSSSTGLLLEDGKMEGKVKQMQQVLKGCVKLWDIAGWVLESDFLFVEGEEGLARASLEEDERAALVPDLGSLDHVKFLHLFFASILANMTQGKGQGNKTPDEPLSAVSRI